MTSVGFRATVDDSAHVNVTAPTIPGWDVVVSIGRYGLEGTLLLSREAAAALSDGILDVIQAGPDDGADELHTRIAEDRAY